MWLLLNVTDVFAAFPVTLQYHMLVNVAETTQDVLQQCRLMLLILDRYPDQVPDQGVCIIYLLYIDITCTLTRFQTRKAGGGGTCSHWPEVIKTHS